jgi:TrmH family RNA methyltransferase
MITSRQNSKIKKAIQLSSQAKLRKSETAFVAEGIRILEESLHSSTQPDFILYTDSLDQRGKSLLSKFKEQKIPCEQVSLDLFKEISSTETPQGMLAVIPIPSPVFPKDPDLVLILDEIRDPGNMGTLMRTSLAAGVDLVILTKGSVDPYSPKVVRSGMGAHFRLPVIKSTWEEIPSLIPGVKFVLAEMNADQDLWSADLTGAVGLIIGSEAHGAGEMASRIADLRVRIPMDSRAESLNAAVAGAILIYETRRQRSQQ